MRRRERDKELHADVGAYLLGALPAPERATFEAHMAGCADCRAAARELRPVTGLLAHAAPAEELPPGLEQRTLTAVRREAELAGDRIPARPRGRGLLPRLAFGGLAVLALAAAFAAGSLTGGDGDSGAGLAQNHPHGGRDGDKLPIQLASSDGAYPRGHAELLASKQGGTVTFHSDHLPALTGGDYYELWLIGPGGERVSGGRFNPDTKGTSYVDLPVSVDPDEYDVVAITRERADGDERPSLPDVVRSDWSVRCAADRPGGPQPGCR